MDKVESQSHPGKMYGLAIEGWTFEENQQVLSWLKESFGDPTKVTWYTDLDWDLENLYMNQMIYTLYCLRWR